MAQIHANPETLKEIAKGAKPGDVIILDAGKYGPLRLRHLAGDPDNPIIITGPRDAFFDGGQSFEDFREEANRIALRAQLEESYPSLGREAYRGHIALKNCSYIRLSGFSVKGCWPTGIYLNNCVGIDLDNVDFREGTYAIFADGRRTRDLRVRNCNYLQDIGEGRIWREIDWDLVHGAQTVDLVRDARAFDGSFFHAFGIAGNVEISGNTVRHAFNGVHIYHSDRVGADRRENQNVFIHGNRFEYIRDNVVEPEWGAWNWWIYHNDICNAHKWFSFQMRNSGHFYVFGNTGWFDEIPGPEGDDNNGGAVFKLPKIQTASEGTHYFFNNSLYLRSAYIKKKQLRHFWHFNNAIQYCRPEGTEDDPCHERGMFGGPLGYGGDVDPPPAFTTSWAELNIRFFANAVDHREYPDVLQERGYELEDGIAASPEFANPKDGDFALGEVSPAKSAGTAMSIDLADGSIWKLPEGLNIGAWQGGQRLAPPENIPGRRIHPALLT